MRTPSRLTFTILAAAFIPVATAAAQPKTVVVYVPRTQTSFVSCAQQPPADDAYAHCALRFKRTHLIRGTPGTELDRTLFLRPAALTRYVHGDSALVYASRYERDVKRGQRLAMVGTSAVLYSVLIARRLCQDIWCTHDRLRTQQRVFMIGGAVLSGVGFKYIVGGGREGDHAVALSNETLAQRRR